MEKKMKTDKQIEEAAKRYTKYRKSCGVESVVVLDEINAAFIAGAEWAQQKLSEECDAVFKWHKRNTKDPVKPEMLEAYLCYDGDVYSIAYKDGRDWFDTNSGDLVYTAAWCKLPPVPQKKDKNPKS